MAKAKKQRTIWDDLVELGREVLDKLDEGLNPDKRRKPVRVPVPVPARRHPQRQAQDQPY